MMNDFKDKVVLITGAGKGAGRALADSFAERGAMVIANDISPVNVDEAVAGIIAHGGKAKAFIEDVAKKVAAQALINTVEDEFGCIDILINHAAVEPHGPLLDMDEWDWHRTLDVNITGAFLMMQSAGRVMRAKGRGVIINVVTGASRELREEAGAYHASMSALAELTRQMARELSPHGVGVFAVENIKQENIAEVVFSLLEEK
jgi:NAD(P)-dependent dehydrogenase (short-subunit alcohol dehydrogenase family)